MQTNVSMTSVRFPEAGFSRCGACRPFERSQSSRRRYNVLLSPHCSLLPSLTKRTVLLASGANTFVGLGVDNDPRTLLNSILGAFGLPKLTESSSIRNYEDVDQGIYLQYPRAWVKRKNTLRPGVYFSNFDSGDRAVLEIFPDNGHESLEGQLVKHFVNPGEEVGGDSRLMSPPANRIKATEKAPETEGQTYVYVEFPTETITRSGYQIRQKNFGVATRKGSTIYTLVSSARSDKFDPGKEVILRDIIDSFRLQR